MEYRPDEKTWVSYLYGELDEQERTKVELYLKTHPEEREQLRTFDETRSIFGKLEDKEVIVPPVFFDSQPTYSKFWSWNILKFPIGMAASFALLLLLGTALGTQVDYSNGQLQIRFSSANNSGEETTQDPGYLTKEDFQQMISESLDSNNKVLESTWLETKDELNKVIQVSMNQNSQRVDELVSVARTASGTGRR